MSTGDWIFATGLVLSRINPLVGTSNLFSTLYLIKKTYSKKPFCNLEFDYFSGYVVPARHVHEELLGEFEKENPYFTAESTKSRYGNKVYVFRSKNEIEDEVDSKLKELLEVLDGFKPMDRRLAANMLEIALECRKVMTTANQIMRFIQKRFPQDFRDEKLFEYSLGLLDDIGIDYEELVKQLSLSTAREVYGNLCTLK